MSSVGAFIRFVSNPDWLGSSEALRYLELSAEGQIGVGQMNSAEREKGSSLMHLIHIICRFHICKFAY